MILNILFKGLLTTEEHHYVVYTAVEWYHKLIFQITFLLIKHQLIHVHIYTYIYIHSFDRFYIYIYIYIYILHSCVYLSFFDKPGASSR